MFDKLKLSTFTKANFGFEERLINEFKLTAEKRLDKYSKRVILFQGKGNVSICVKEGDRMFGGDRTIIEINPSRFDSFNEMNRAIDVISPTDNLKITRIDHCIDLEIPILEVLSVLRIKNKDYQSNYEESFRHCYLKTGCVFGKKPNRIMIYDKTVEVEKRIGKGDFISSISPLTRIEVKQEKNSIPIKEFHSLPKYVFENPFKSLVFIDFYPEAMFVKTRDIEKLSNLKKESIQFGFNTVLRKYNYQKGGNFAKVYGKYYFESSLNQKILEDYQKNLSIFFNGGENE